jgi:hypothetical protein
LEVISMAVQCEAKVPLFLLIPEIYTRLALDNPWLYWSAHLIWYTGGRTLDTRQCQTIWRIWKLAGLCGCLHSSYWKKIFFRAQPFNWVDVGRWVLPRFFLVWHYLGGVWYDRSWPRLHSFKSVKRNWLVAILPFSLRSKTPGEQKRCLMQLYAIVSEYQS